jgi:hypothetical protein
MQEDDAAVKIQALQRGRMTRMVAKEQIAGQDEPAAMAALPVQEKPKPRSQQEQAKGLRPKRLTYRS